MIVSIHAPVKGATHAYLAKVLESIVSIHAPVKGATDKPPPPDWMVEFQSTLP